MSDTQHFEQESPYLDESEAAAYLRVSAKTLKRRRLGGHGPRHRRHGVQVLYTRPDLDAWSDRQARTGLENA